MGKSQSKDEVKEEERKEEHFVSTYCKAMRSLSSSSLHPPLNFDNMNILSLFLNCKLSLLIIFRQRDMSQQMLCAFDANSTGITAR